MDCRVPDRSSGDYSHAGCAALRKLFVVCNTMGQIKRVWPNACTLLPESAQLILRNAKVQSPYPDGVRITRTDGNGCTSYGPDIDPCWSAENLSWFDDRLTEALCLPMTYDEQGIPSEIEYSVSS